MIHGALALALSVSPSIVVAESEASDHSPSFRIAATIRTAGTRAPIAQARVMIVPAEPESAVGPLAPRDHLDPNSTQVAWVRSEQTDERGQLDIADLEQARVRLIVIAPGHVRHEEIIDARQSPRRGFTLFVSPSDDSTYRTVVETTSDAPPERVKSTVMEAEEIRTAPGSQGDPLRAIQNLPGVARTPGGLGVLVLRGASPNQSRVFLGGHPLPRAFHSLAIASVVPAAAIDRMEFVPSNFDARYGDATGGVVILHPAVPQREGVHGHARLDVLGAGAVAGGPLREGHYLVAAQRGWVDGVLGVVERIDPTQTFLLPRYYDYQVFVSHPVGRRGTLSARGLGAGDRIQARGIDPVNPSGRPTTNFELISQFHRADLSYRVRRAGWTFWVTPSFRFERNGTRQPQGSTRAIRNDAVFSTRVEVSRALTRRFDLLVGSDLEIDRYEAESRSRGDPLLGEGTIAIDERGVQTSLGTYVRAILRIRNWILAPGVRASAFTLGNTARAAIDPRLNAHWSFRPGWRWSMGAGLYSQARVEQTVVQGGFVRGSAGRITGNVILPASILALEPRAGFLPADGGLAVARALQASTALSRELAEHWFVEVGAWGRLRDNADGLEYGQDGSVSPATSTWSSAYGLEVLLRRRLGPKMWGWAGYTLSRADIRPLDIVSPDDDRSVRPTSFDQRHNLVVLASYRLPKGWRVGGRFRLVSGSPFTDVVGRVWSATAGPLPAWGARNGARFPLFHQLDVRVDKSWLLQRVEIGAYVDVQNIYNHRYPEAFIYDYDYSRRVDAVGLPIFPSVGVRVDY